VLDFEKNVVQLFQSHKIEFEFNLIEHYLISEPVSIIFIPDCSLKEFNPKVEITANSKKNIRIWEDEYIHHKAIIDSRISSIIGISHRIYARETIIKTIAQTELEDFLILNHLNAPIMAKYRYGLYYQHELVAIAAFSRSCPIQDNGITYISHELIRYCSLLNVTIVGGLSKLIHHFEQEKKPEHLMTYVDREWSDGGTYQKLGFNIVDRTPPQKFWISPENYKRVAEKVISKNKSAGQLLDEGWTKFNNLGNLKLVKFLK
jgi:hypothetical protein